MRNKDHLEVSMNEMILLRRSQKFWVTMFVVILLAYFLILKKLGCELVFPLISDDAVWTKMFCQTQLEAFFCTNIWRMKTMRKGQSEHKKKPNRFNVLRFTINRLLREFFIDEFFNNNSILAFSCASCYFTAIRRKGCDLGKLYLRP